MPYTTAFVTPQSVVSGMLSHSIRGYTLLFVVSDVDYDHGEETKRTGRQDESGATRAGGAGKRVDFLSDQKLSSIMSFLDQVDSDSRLGDIDQVNTHSVVDFHFV